MSARNQKGEDRIDLDCISILLYFKFPIFVGTMSPQKKSSLSYLLEDEQELSLGMLMRPKRINNFCLFHSCFGDIAIHFDALSYHLQLIWTNLLTKCPVPVSVYSCPCIAEKG